LHSLRTVWPDLEHHLVGMFVFYLSSDPPPFRATPGLLPLVVAKNVGTGFSTEMPDRLLSSAYCSPPFLSDPKRRGHSAVVSRTPPLLVTWNSPPTVSSLTKDQICFPIPLFTEFRVEIIIRFYEVEVVLTESVVTPDVLPLLIMAVFNGWLADDPIQGFFFGRRGCSEQESRSFPCRVINSALSPPHLQNLIGAVLTPIAVNPPPPTFFFS